jgi:hypothetical protein
MSVAHDFTAAFRVVVPSCHEYFPEELSALG